MKQFFLAFCFLIYIQLFIGCSINHFQEITQQISRIKVKYSPDSRTSLFNVKAIRNGGLAVTGETNVPNAYYELDSLLKADFPEIKNLVALLPDLSRDSLAMGIVTVSVANLRATPDHSAELLTQAILGTPVKVLKKELEWYLVQTPDAYLGWMTGAGLKLYTKNRFQKESNFNRIIFTELAGTCYSQVDKNSMPVSDLVAGSILETKGSETGFLEVSFPDGRTGYVNQDQCMPLNEWNRSFPPSRESIVKTALQFNGLPYLWGGTSSKGVDCSGFTKTVYYMNGIILQRDASQQALYGELVDTRNNFNNLEPGDLLFFGTHKTDSTRERISHVGIYIGNAKIIHASGMVKIDSLVSGDEDYNSNLVATFICARCILTCIDQPGIQSVFSSKLYFPSSDDFNN